MLRNAQGQRKYLTSEERSSFLEAAKRHAPEVGLFCFLLAHSGARISEILNLKVRSIDLVDQVVILETLKKRRRGVYRSIPLPRSLLDALEQHFDLRARQLSGLQLDQKLWLRSRTTAWLWVKRVMADAQVISTWAVPKGLRHGFGVEAAASQRIPLNIVQRWLGHSRIETTAIYADAVGREERRLALRLWDGDDQLLDWDGSR
jgi:integrase